MVLFLDYILPETKIDSTFDPVMLDPLPFEAVKRLLEDEELTGKSI